MPSTITMPDFYEIPFRAEYRNGKCIVGKIIFMALVSFIYIQCINAQSVWTKQNSGTTSMLNSVIWAGNQFVAAGDSGVILTSPDGVSWTRRNSGVKCMLFNVARAGDLIVVVGSAILTSPDGVLWTQRNNDNKYFYTLLWANNQLFAGGGEYIYRSMDGITWNSVCAGTGTPILNIVWTGSSYIALAEYSRVWISSNGLSWEKKDIWLSLICMVWDGKKIIGSSGGLGIYSSTDGTTWKPIGDVPVDPNASTKTFSHSIRWFQDIGLYFLCGGYEYIYYSLNGINWNKNPLTGIIDAAFSGTTFVVVGAQGLIYSSPKDETSIEKKPDKSGPPDPIRFTQTASRLHIAVPGYITGRTMSITLYDLHGRQACCINAVAGTAPVICPLAAVPAGRYTVVIKAGKSEFSKEVFIVK